MMKERFTEVANISTDVLSELGKLVSAYKDYTETLADSTETDRIHERI